jgi:hypothetical protein
VGRIHRSVVLSALALGCGPSGGAPEIIGLADQTAFVGSELIVEIRASDPDLEIIRFSFESTLDTLAGNAVIEHTGNGAALFRWTPMAADVGSWAIDFLANDGRNTTTETILIEVRAVSESAPVFRRPIAVGATLDLAESRCLDVDIEVEDPDTTDVEIRQVAPTLEGARLDQESSALATWRWCPTAEQVAQSDRHVLILAADDHDNPPTLKHFLIVLRGDQVATPVDLGGFRLIQTGAACVFTLPAPTLVAPGGAVIIARDASLSEFESFWGVSLPANVLYVNSADVCPRINGDETFALKDAAGFDVDGPTPLLAASSNIQRISHVQPSSQPASWTLDSAAPLGATPGVANRDEGSGAIYLSEISDTSGSGAFVFEFVEISVD